MLVGFFRISSLRYLVSNVMGQNVLHIPSGADGGLYGSGCLNFSNSFSVSMNSTCTITESAPLANVRTHPREMPHPLLSTILHVLLCIEKGTNVDGLSSPQVPLHCPVHRQFQGSSVQRPVNSLDSPSCSLAFDKMNTELFWQTWQSESPNLLPILWSAS